MLRLTLLWWCGVVYKGRVGFREAVVSGVVECEEGGQQAREGCLDAQGRLVDEGHITVVTKHAHTGPSDAHDHPSALPPQAHTQTHTCASVSCLCFSPSCASMASTLPARSLTEASCVPRRGERFREVWPPRLEVTTDGRGRGEEAAAAMAWHYHHLSMFTLTQFQPLRRPARSYTAAHAPSPGLPTHPPRQGAWPPSP